jgi:HSP20 family protein
MASVIRWEPMRDFGTLKTRMDRLFDQFSRNWETEEGLTAGTWVPPVDVYETNDSIVLKLDLPEVRQEDVDISVEGNTLLIRGERKKEKEIEEKNYHRVERQYGSFARSFTLPPTLDTERIDAAFSTGVLKLTLPKREEAKPKQIKVKINGDGATAR